MKTDLRKEFPYLVTGAIYLNHASVGPYPNATAQAVSNHNRGRQFGPIENLDSDLKTLMECKENLAKLMKAPSIEHIALIGSTSSGINSALSTLSWDVGDEILVADIEFPSNVLPYKNLEKYGVTVTILKTENGDVPVELFEKAISEKTKVIAVSAVQFLSGYQADLQRIGDLCKKHNLLFFVDAIQGLGIMDIDVQKSHIDVLAGAGHKWLLAPFGTGYMYASKRILQGRPAQKGWLSVSEPWNLFDFEQDFAHGASRFEMGVNNVAGYYGLNATLKWFAQIGPEFIRSSIEELTEFLLTLNDEHLGWSTFYDGKSKYRGGIVTLEIPDNISADQLIAELKELNISLSVREGRLRISPHFYNTLQELEYTFQKIMELTKTHF